MTWEFDDDFWDLDPEDFDLFNGLTGLLDEELDEEELLERMNDAELEFDDGDHT